MKLVERMTKKNVMKLAKPRIMLNIDGIFNGKYAVRPTMIPVMMATIIRILSSDKHIPLHVFQLITPGVSPSMILTGMYNVQYLCLLTIL